LLQTLAVQLLACKSRSQGYTHDTEVVKIAISFYEGLATDEQITL